MNSKMTTNSQLSTPEPKNKNKVSKQLEQEQNHRNSLFFPQNNPPQNKQTNKQKKNHRNRDHMEGYQWGQGGEWGKRYRE